MIEQLYQAYYQELLAYLTKRTENTSTAEDIAQEAFLRALCHWNTLEPLSNSQRRAWLYRTAKNIMIDLFRQNKRLGNTRYDLTSASDLTQIETAMLFHVLSPQDRSMFYLRYFCGYNATELGEMFSLSPANVRMRLKAARTKLKKEIEYYDK